MSSAKAKRPMAERAKAITIAGLADLHVEETSAHPFRELFLEISGRADVLVLCGDLTNLGKPREAEILAEDLRSCTIPVLGVLGNHDFESGEVPAVTQILQQAGLHWLETQVHEIGGVAFAGVKGFCGGFDNRMLSPFGEEAIKRFAGEAVNEALRLENALRALTAERIVVALHYAPVAATVMGEPEQIFPFLGSSRLAETIDRFTVSAVLHGHAHHGSYEGRTPKGIPVYNCAKPVPKPDGRAYALIKV
jgi:Icc-related predicted phosphoesterase